MHTTTWVEIYLLQYVYLRIVWCTTQLYHWKKNSTRTYFIISPCLPKLRTRHKMNVKIDNWYKAHSYTCTSQMIWDRKALCPSKIMKYIISRHHWSRKCFSVWCISLNYQHQYLCVTRMHLNIWKNDGDKNFHIKPSGLITCLNTNNSEAFYMLRTRPSAGLIWVAVAQDFHRK